MDRLPRGILAALVFFTLVSAPLKVVANAGAATNDPWEAYNRKVFAFNDFFDRWLLKPMVYSYKFVTPDPLETGVSNAFENLLEPASVLNDVLQWKWKAAGRDLGRFVVNSTAGVVGLWDVADMIGWKKPAGAEDFGQTLRVWGVPAGPYFVIPLLGPYTLTEGFVAAPIDFFTHPVSYTESVRAYNTLSVLKIVDARSQLLAAEELISGDRYIFIREGYLQNRAFKAADGQVVDDFGADTDLQDL